MQVYERQEKSYHRFYFGRSLEWSILRLCETGDERFFYVRGASKETGSKFLPENSPIVRFDMHDTDQVSCDVKT